MTQRKGSYGDTLARVRALLDLALAECDLPRELRLEGQAIGAEERARIAEFAQLVVSGNIDALREVVSGMYLVPGLDRSLGEVREDGVPELDDARQRVLKRLKERKDHDSRPKEQ